MAYKLVLIRHGQSTWNKENRFTGWTDVDLSEQGYKEAQECGKVLLKEGYTFDVAFTSLQKRAIRTLWIVQDEMDLMWIPVHFSWRLNEKHYGALQGFNKAEMAVKEGEEQVFLWRRDYNTRPPALDEDDERHPKHDPRYKDLDPADIPATECLHDTYNRFLPYWNETIAPVVKSGKKVVISAHGNSLRALVKHLDSIPDEEISQHNIPTGIPLVYELDEDLKPIKHYYIGDAEAVKKAQEAVKKQGHAK